MGLPVIDGNNVATCSSIQDAAAIIKRNLLLDRESIDLSNQLAVSSMYSGVCSGLKEEDYPTTDRIRLPLITDVRRVPLPPELVEQFGHMQCNCIIGVFPEIGRAWLTVDSDIFVWRYSDGDDLAYFDGLAETILSVALVQPKIGIFREHIKYLLVLTTPLDIVILGISFTNDDINNEMHLLPDPLFTLSSDGAYLLNTVGTDVGRIFTGGRDGCLYEIVYQASGGWFSRRCSKINHSRSRLSFLLPSVVNVWLNDEDSISQLTIDDTRNILYTRSEKGTITVYDLGVDGLSMTCAAQFRLDSIQRRARDIASGIEPSNLNEIIHIAPVTMRESRHIHLVAVTQSGVRLYFMTCQSNITGIAGAMATDISKLRPSGIYLVHVRLPPGFTGSSVQRPTAVHSAHYNIGTLLLASTNGDDGILWCINRDMYAFDNILKETQCNLALDGRSWVISEVPSPMSQLSSAALPPGDTMGLPPNPPIHVTQHTQKPSEYVIITSQGCHMFNKLRPVDQLRHILDTTSDPESQIIEAFFKLYRHGEAAACCIILAMSNVPTDRHIVDRAVAAFIHHGGIPHHHPLPAPIVTSPTSVGGLTGLGVMSPIATGSQRQPQMSIMRTPGGLPVVSTPMPGYNPPPPVMPVQYPSVSSPPPSSTPGGAAASATGSSVSDLFYYSERQQGAYKMFARITRPLWEGRLVEDYVVTEAGKQRIFMISRLDVDVIALVLEEMNSLRNFVNKHCLSPVPMRDVQFSSHDRARSFQPHFHPGSSVQQDIQRKQLAEAAAGELSSMQCLHELLHRSTEVLGLWRLLLHHQLHVLFEALDKTTQSALKTMTFHDLVLSGNQLCSALISTLVGQFIDDNSTVDALSGQLREVCPSLYSPDDAICSKASELLNAVRTSTASQKKEILQEASKLFQRIAHSVNLPVVIQQFQSVRFYTGAVELCLRAAQKRDEEGLALKLYQSAHATNDPEVDPDFRRAYLARAECYKCITDMLDELMAIGESLPQTPSVPSQPGPPKPTQAPSGSGITTFSGTLQPEEAQQHAEACLQLALQSNDELLHVTLYEWMLKKEMAGQLLKVTSPFVESFLRRVAESQDENPTSLGAAGSDLLWQYYERNKQHASAASILANLAEKPGADRDLVKRIEYMSRAKMNAKSVTSVTADTTTGGQLLHELEEKLEVAQIQLETLVQLKDLNEHEAVARLNAQLVDVTTLYRDYAEPYQLAECKLSIVHCAGMHDPTLVEALWQNIIEHELNKPSTIDMTQSKMLKHKIVQLGQRYISSQRYFPVEFLVAFLEKVELTRGWEINWAFSCLLESGFPLTDLLDIYGKIHSQKLPYWASFGNPYHLLFVVNEILNTFLDEPTKYIPSGHQRRHFINRSLDAMAVHLVQLRSITAPGETVRDIIAKLRRTQASLEAMQDRH